MYLLSYFKSNWGFEDYPLETWSNQNAKQDEIKYGASFTNWTSFVAHGKTKDEAVENLKANFNQYRKENELPRPGTLVPIQYAETDRIEQFEAIAVDFFDKIIEINYYDCFVSDLSSLHDFGLGDEAIIKKIKSEYGIEPKDKDLFLVDVFEQIKNKMK